MSEMLKRIFLLSKPHRYPEEVHLFDRRRMRWPHLPEPVDCRIFKFRFGSKWHYGLTGPVTFVLFGHDFDGKSPEEIYAAYAKWWNDEEVANYRDEEIWWICKGDELTR